MRFSEYFLPSVLSLNNLKLHKTKVGAVACLAPPISWSVGAMLRHIVVFCRAHSPAIHAASHVDHEKRVSWLSISIHACQFYSYRYGVPLDVPSGRQTPL